MSGSAAGASHLQAPYLGPEPLLGHHLCLLLQQGIAELLCLPHCLLFLLLLVVRFPCLQLALCNLGTNSESARDKAHRQSAASDQDRKPEGLPWLERQRRATVMESADKWEGHLWHWRGYVCGNTCLVNSSGCGPRFGRLFCVT